jgi:polysaccharide export outer membrane protein
VTNRNLEYITDRDKGVKSFDNTRFEDYKIKENDDLYITITSLDDASSANVFKNSAANQEGRSMDVFAASLISHTVDKDGFLNMPVLGNVLVKDKTIAQIQKMITESLTNVLNQPLVTVKLVNRFVSVIGEVRNPGHFSFTQDKLSIYDAISLAGDITDYGNRKQVVLVRNQNGKNLRINLNLSSSDILSSQYYFLNPNDIVYVKPLKRKFWGMKEFPFSTILTAVTSTIVVLQYMSTH